MGDHVRENVKRNNHSYRHVIGNDTYRTAKSRRRHKRKLHTTNRHDMRSQLARLDQNHDIDSAMVPVKTHRSWRFPKRDELSYTILVTRYAHRVTYIKECDDEAGSLFMEPISRTSGRRGNRKVTKQVKRQLMELESKRDQIADEIETYNASVPIHLVKYRQYLFPDDADTLKRHLDRVIEVGVLPKLKHGVPVRKYRI